MIRILYLMSVTVPITAVIKCSTACKRCQERDTSFEVLEIYCSMCLECRERKKERSLYRRQENGDVTETEATPPECPPQLDCPPQPECPPQPNCTPQPECPTQPECETEANRPIEITSTTTARPTCPPVIPCKVKRTTPKPVASCIPCLPICNLACPGVTPAPAAATTVTEHDYAYFGVPKQVWKSWNQN